MSEKIDTKAFGLLTHMNTRRSLFKERHPPGTIEFRFDTGIVMYVPAPMADCMQFHLEECDPEAPNEPA